MSTAGPSVHFGSEFLPHVTVSTCCSDLGAWRLLQPLQDASSLDMPRAWSISQILAGGEGMLMCVVGGRSGGLLSTQWGKEFVLLEREEVTMEREEEKERERRGEGETGKGQRP